MTSSPSSPPRRPSDIKPNLHPELIAAIEHALARDPEARFPNIESLSRRGYVRGRRAFRASADSSLISGNFPLRISALDPKHSVLTPLKAAPRHARARVIAVAVALVLCATWAR
jgi:hypothetical protein